MQKIFVGVLFALFAANSSYTMEQTVQDMQLLTRQTSVDALIVSEQELPAGAQTVAEMLDQVQEIFNSMLLLTSPALEQACLQFCESSQVQPAAREKLLLMLLNARLESQIFIKKQKKAALVIHENVRASEEKYEKLALQARQLRESNEKLKAEINSEIMSFINKGVSHE